MINNYIMYKKILKITGIIGTISGGVFGIVKGLQFYSGKKYLELTMSRFEKKLESSKTKEIKEKICYETLGSISTIYESFNLSYEKYIEPSQEKVNSILEKIKEA